MESCRIGLSMLLPTSVFHFDLPFDISLRILLMNMAGTGDSFGLNQSYPNDASVGNCKYSKAIPHSSGGSLDSEF
ncbi:inosine/uridine-preferring nucleoside hydrolase domain-containing protein [Artemisia annua]|uniref:Inosine/uridine-preferring nucleoside hydrolase domain-containing protein n=1 Tax=Artemisia annua TaxID=35608 RepID=A0A2U1NDI4_ARTAN|nr:inosine/uridine-preferring nucleoside hydrolase domain-containing protein [Artemisia annua]